MKRRRLEKEELVSELEASAKLQGGGAGADGQNTGVTREAKPDASSKGKGIYAALPESMAADLGVTKAHESRDAVHDLVVSVMGQGVDTGRIWSHKLRDKAVSLDNRKDFKSAAERKAEKLEKRREKKQRKVMKAKEKREKSLLQIPQQAQKYELYVPLHTMWKEYITATVQESTKAALTAKLLKVDMHGCNIKVTRSKCPSLIGIEGIVILETEQTFQIITPTDQLRVVPKANNVFTFVVGNQVVTLYGNNFAYRASDRAARKFKSKPTTEL